MAFPIPIFAADDWLVVWVFPTVMALIFGVFVRDRDLFVGGDRRPILHRFVSNFVVFASVWIPFQIVSAAMERGAQAQGFGAPGGWGFGIGLAAGMIVFAVLLVVAATVRPVGDWLALKRNPFKSAGQS